MTQHRVFQIENSLIVPIPERLDETLPRLKETGCGEQFVLQTGLKKRIVFSREMFRVHGRKYVLIPEKSEPQLLLSREPEFNLVTDSPVKFFSCLFQWVYKLSNGDKKRIIHAFLRSQISTFSLLSVLLFASFNWTLPSIAEAPTVETHDPILDALLEFAQSELKNTVTTLPEHSIQEPVKPPEKPTVTPTKHVTRRTVCAVKKNQILTHDIRQFLDERESLKPYSGGCSVKKQ